MKKIIPIIIAALSFGCSQVEPIDVIAPTREVDTAGLASYKAHLKDRKVSIGMLYGWGKKNESVLMHTPDSLDIIVVKDGYQNIDSYQQNDLSQTRQAKSTKVLFGVDFRTLSASFEKLLEANISAAITEKKKELEKSEDFLSDAELTQIFDEIRSQITGQMVQEAQSYLENLKKESIGLLDNFDGISIELPENHNDAYSLEQLSTFISEVQGAAEKAQKFLILENPYAIDANLLEKADWIVYRQATNPQTLANFANKAQEWGSRFVPAVDFTNEELSKGFSDTARFPIVSQQVEICSWEPEKKSGVAFYHIEQEYFNLVGKVTYKSLRESINKLQHY